MQNGELETSWKKVADEEIQRSTNPQAEFVPQEL